MSRIKSVFKKLFTSITIMVIPHSSRAPITLRVPCVAILAVAALSLIGTGYVYNLSKEAILYKPTKEKLDYYSSQITDLQSTISSLKMAETEFNRLFAYNSKEEILDNLNTSDSGALDMDVLRRQINKTIDNIGEIKDYLSEARDLYRATPMGNPLDNGWIASSYGRRNHPIRGGRDFHTGIDLSARPGEPIKVTADGVVSYSGRSGANGNLVAVEHGFGYQSFYAHNKKNVAKVGQVVNRGEIIAYVGSTGSSTGPHVHYEIWKDGKNTNPKRYLKGGNW
jgi:murein DD-endopeptidase MepM/ murein hydrolase activator NlpD